VLNDEQPDRLVGAPAPHLRPDQDHNLLPIWSTVALFAAIQVIDQLLSRRVSLLVLADESIRREAIQTVEAVTDVLFVVTAFVVIVAAVIRTRPSWMNRILIAYLALATLNLVLNVATLVATAQFRPVEELRLLADLALVYANTVLVFAVWYRLLDAELDGGAFEFPEDPKRPGRPQGWIDYVFLSFNTNATFGPTAEVVHARTAKVLMMVQTSLSLLVLVVLLARIVGLSD
jgi:hypothetical protein